MFGISELPNKNPQDTLSPDDSFETNELKRTIRQLFSKPDIFNDEQRDVLKQVLDDITRNIITVDNFDVKVTDEQKFSFLIDEYIETGFNVRPLGLLRALVDPEISRQVKLGEIKSRGFHAKR